MGHLEVVSTREGSWSGEFPSLSKEIPGLLYVESQSAFFQWDRSTWYPYRCLRAMDQTDQTEACPETVSSVAWYRCQCLRAMDHQTDQTEACPKTVSSVAFVKPFILDNPSEMQWGKSDKWDMVFWARVSLGSDYYIVPSSSVPLQANQLDNAWDRKLHNLAFAGERRQRKVCP
jgi:hypothetical protein